MSKYLYTVYYGSTCNKMYIRDIMVKNNIWFKKEISLAEDFLFNLDYLKFVRFVSINTEALYCYYQEHEESLTKTKDVWYLWDMAKLRLQYCKEKYKDMGMLDSCNNNIDTAIANELVRPTYSIINNREMNGKKAIAKLKDLYSSTFTRNAIKNTNNPQMMRRIARMSLRFYNFTIFYILMKIWVKVQRYEGE